MVKGYLTSSFAHSIRASVSKHIVFQASIVSEDVVVELGKHPSPTTIDDRGEDGLGAAHSHGFHLANDLMDSILLLIRWVTVDN